MATTYVLYADERQTNEGDGRWLWFGGIVCTDVGSDRLHRRLDSVRNSYGLAAHEMKWAKISRAYLPAYRAWVDTFFDDLHARYKLFSVHLSSSSWANFRPRQDRPPRRDDRLASAYYQYLLFVFGSLGGLRRWEVYPDAGFFSHDKVLGRVEYLFNTTYKKAFGHQSSRIIRRASPQDSAATQLIQLADVLLGVFTFAVHKTLPSSPSKAQLVQHCCSRLQQQGQTKNGLPRLSHSMWVPPQEYVYHQ